MDVEINLLTEIFHFLYLSDESLFQDSIRITPVYRRHKGNTGDFEEEATAKSVDEL
jgi:hypothetical protein